MRRVWLAVLVLGCLYWPSAGYGAPQRVIGPGGGAVNSVAAVGDSIWADTAVGIFRSDGGGAWQFVSDAPALLGWGGIAFPNQGSGVGVDPHNPRRLFSGWGVSTDGGGTWRQIDNPGSWFGAGARLISSDGTFFATTEQSGPSSSEGIAVSWDGGKTFHLEDKGCPGWSGQDVFASPAGSHVVLAATVCGVQRSADDGHTWQTVLTTSRFYSSHVFGDAQGDTSGDVWAVADNSFERSSDGGVTWTVEAAAGGFGQAVGASGDRIIAGGFPSGIEFASIGGSFKQATILGPQPLPRLAEVATDASNPRAVYAVMGAFGVLRSTDSGETWQPFNDGLTASNVTSVARDPAQPDTLYATTDSGYGVWRSTDHGITWRIVTPNPQPAINQITVSPAGRVFAGGGPDAQGRLEAWASYDHGATWGPAASGVSDIAVALSDPRVVYGIGPSAVQRSADGGATWTTIQTLPLGGWSSSLTIAVDAGDPNLVYAERPDGTFELSRDGGATWQAIPSRLPRITGGFVTSNPYQPGAAYISDWGWIAWSTDGFRTICYAGTTNTLAILPDPSRAAAVFVGTEGHGILGTNNLQCSPSASVSSTSTPWLPIDASSAGTTVSALLPGAQVPLAAFGRGRHRPHLRALLASIKTRSNGDGLENFLLFAPHLTKRPRLIFDARFAEFTCDGGVWSTPVLRQYRWWRDGRRIRRRLFSTLMVSKADAGHRYRCLVIASNLVGKAEAASRQFAIPRRF